MTQIHHAKVSTNVLHHRYDDSLYGETPKLSLPGENSAATDLARLMVKLGVDGRGPQAERASAQEMLDGFPLLLALTKASAPGAPGFAVDVRASQEDGSGRIRAVYTFAQGEVGLLVSDRPPLAETGRMFNLRWVMEDGLFVPQAAENQDPPDLEAAAQMYADISSRITDPNVTSPLKVNGANLNLYQPLTPLALGSTVIAQRPPSA